MNDEFREKTANEFTAVKDIKDNFLYTKDNYIFGYLKVENFNIDLLSIDEKRQKTEQLSRALGEDRKNFSYVSFPRELDLDEYKNFLKNAYQDELDSIGKRGLISILIKEANDLSTSGENFEHQHFIKVWAYIGKNENDARHEIITRLEDFKEKYNLVGVKSSILDSTAIIKLCNLFGNAMQAAYEIVEDNMYYTKMSTL